MNREHNGDQADRDAERARWVSKYRASGLGLERFARRHGLRPGRLHYWVYQSGRSRGPTAPVPIFTEVRLPGQGSSAGSWSAEIGLSYGTTVRLAREADPSWAMALVDALRRPCSP